MPTQFQSTIYSVCICVLYMFIGPTLILINQHILKGLKFPYPMFLSGLGVLASALVAQVLVRSGFVQLQRKDAVDGLLWYKRVLPVGMAHASTLAFGNAVYLYLNVGFIQMLKSFTPVIVMITGYVASIDNPTMPVIYSVVVITLGTIMTCTYNPELNILGIGIMFMAELTEAVRLILTQFFLQQLKFGVVEGQYVLAPASAFWLFFASAIYEFDHMYTHNAFQTIANNPTIFFVASFMGLGVNFLTYLVIQQTSSLTMKILGTARNVFTVVIGVLYYNEVVTFDEAMGYMVALLGFILYNMAKAGQLDNLSVSQWISRLTGSSATNGKKEYLKVASDDSATAGGSGGISVGGNGGGGGNGNGGISSV